MEEGVRKSVKAERYSKANLVALSLQIIGLMAIISGLFGVGYQKGMILTMNLGNLSGNYEIREVFNSAVLGYLHVLSTLQIDNYWPIVIKLLTDNIALLLTLITLGLLVPLIIRHESKIKTYLSNITVTPKSIRAKVFKSFIWSPVIIVSSVYSVLFSFFLAIYMIPILVGFLVIPTLLGYVAGEDYVEKAMVKSFCVPITDEMLESDKLRQCTQVSIKGKTITAKIFLETSDAYFMRRNNAFIYATKNGSNCIYSIYADPKDAKNNDSFKFVDEEILALCNIEIGKKWKLPAAGAS